MKFFVALLLTAVLAFLAGIWLPWWSLALAACVAGCLIPQTALRSFLSAFIALFLLWAGLAFWIDYSNDSVLSVRVAGLLPGPDTGLFMVLLTGLVAGIVAGLAALTGHYIRARPRHSR